MYVAKNTLVLLAVLLSNLGAFASEFCYVKERYPRKLQTAEECAARCAESKFNLHSWALFFSCIVLLQPMKWMAKFVTHGD